MSLDQVVSELFSVAAVFIVLAATIVALFYRSNVDNSGTNFRDAVNELNNNNKEVAANNKSHPRVG